MIELKNITKKMGNKLILNDISLQLEEGEIFGLLGRNGSGKTTLLRVIQQIIAPDRGDVYFKGIRVKDHPKVKRNIAFMPVNQPFYDKYNYKQLAELLKNIYPDFDVTYANELINRYGISETVKFRELSTGLKKQLSLVLTLAIKPAVIILDEPTDGIDAVTRHDVLQLLIDEVSERKTTILITSHRLEDIERMCNRIGFMDDNQLSQVMDLDELKADYTKLQVVFEDDVNLQIREKGISILDKAGVFYTLLLRKDDEEKKEFIKTLNPKVWNEIPVSLEEVFIAKFGGKRRW